MNYYLARDGKTYGPYPKEFIPAMVQQGQLTPDDLLCPQGGSEWKALREMPELMTAAAPAATPAASAAPVAGGGLRMRSSDSTGHAASAGATEAAAAGGTVASAQPAASMSRASGPGLGRMLKLAGVAVVGIVVLVVLVAGFMAAQRERKELAKLHVLPGWTGFDTANHKIDSESVKAGYGNNGEAERFSTVLATMLEEVQRENFKIQRSTPRLSGRSKLGKVVAVASAVNSATAGNGHFQTFVELRPDRAVVLVHIPEFKLYKGETRKAITEMCWEGALVMFAQLQKEAQEESRRTAGGPSPTPAPSGTTTRPPGGRTTTRRPATARPPAPAAEAPAPVTAAAKAEPKFRSDLPIVVGVRGKHDYECVFVGTIANPQDSPPAPTKENVPSQRLLTQWFGEEKPQ